MNKYELHSFYNVIPFIFCECVKIKLFLPAIESVRINVFPVLVHVQVRTERLTAWNIYFLTGHTFQLQEQNEDYCGDCRHNVTGLKTAH